MLESRRKRNMKKANELLNGILPRLEAIVVENQLYRREEDPELHSHVTGILSFAGYKLTFHCDLYDIRDHPHNHGRWVMRGAECFQYMQRDNELVLLSRVADSFVCISPDEAEHMMHDYSTKGCDGSIYYVPDAKNLWSKLDSSHNYASEKFSENTPEGKLRRCIGVQAKHRSLKLPALQIIREAVRGYGGA